MYLRVQRRIHHHHRGRDGDGCGVYLGGRTGPLSRSAMYDTDLIADCLRLFGHPKRLPLSVSPRGFITPGQAVGPRPSFEDNPHSLSSSPIFTPAPAMNTPNGSAQVKKQEDSDDSPQKSGSKLDAKPASRTLNRVPRTCALLDSFPLCLRSHPSHRCLRV